jgi:hypothetical protein
MDRLGTFLGLLMETAGSPLFLVPAAILLPIAIYAGIRTMRKEQVIHRWRVLGTLLLPSVFPLLILLCGVFFESDRLNPSDIGDLLIRIFAFLEVPVCLWVGWRMKSLWQVAVPLVLLQLWLSLLTGIVSSMSVLGIWM